MRFGTSHRRNGRRRLRPLAHLGLLVALLVSQLMIPSAATAASWGEVVFAGSAWNGVDVYFNGPYFLYESPENNYVGGVDTGGKWQAEELAQRFYYVKYGMPSPWDISVPADIFTAAPSMGLTTVRNGYGTPEYGDLVVWGPTIQGTANGRGHVAVVTEVTSSGVRVAEQNTQSYGTRVLSFSNNRFSDYTILGFVKHPVSPVGPLPDVVTASITVSSQSIDAGDVLTLTGAATDSRAHAIATYEWSSDVDGLLASSASPVLQTSTLSVGTHNLSLRAKCASGTWSKPVSVAVTVSPVDAVDAQILSISPNPAAVRQTVTLKGSATDSLGHAVTAYEWSSDLKGVIGYSATLYTSSLPEGTNTITFRAKCENGVWSEPVSQQLVVGTQTPVDTVTISSATASSSTSTYGTAVSFTGSATDSLGHALSYQWLEGTTVLANTASFSKSNLSVGTHTLTFKATCSSGVSATRNVSVTVQSAPVDTVTISSATASSSTSTYGTAVSFTGSATDSLGHALSYQWLEGTTVLANTASFSKSNLSVGTHTLTFKATCSSGVSATRNVSVTVQSAPVDTVTISSATASSSTSTYGTAVSFTGSATDSLGHALSYQWLEGTTVLASTASFSKSNLSVGTHTLTFKATCSSGVSATRNVSVTVKSAPVDTVTISSATASSSTSTYGTAVSFTGSATDSLGHALSYQWLEGTTVLANTASFSKSNLSVGHPHAHLQGDLLERGQRDEERERDGAERTGRHRDSDDRLGHSESDIREQVHLVLRVSY